MSTKEERAYEKAVQALLDAGITHVAVYENHSAPMRDALQRVMESRGESFEEVKRIVNGASVTVTPRRPSLL